MNFNIEEEVQADVVNLTANDVINTTLPVPVNPFDIEAVKVHFAQYLEKVDEMYDQAEALVVDNDEANGQATALGTSAMKLFKKIEAVKDELTEEARTYVKGVDQIAKTLNEKLYSINKKNLTVVAIAKNKIAQFTAFKEQQRQEQELIAKKATEELQKKLNENAEKSGTIAPTVAQPVFRKAETVTRTETGSSYTEKEWTFEIVSPNYVRQLVADLNIQWKELCDILNRVEGTVAIPPKFYLGVRDTLKELSLLFPYLVLSDQEIRKAIKGGIRDMGNSIRIYQKTNVSFR